MILKLIIALIFGCGCENLTVFMSADKDGTYRIIENHRDSLPGDEVVQVFTFGEVSAVRKEYRKVYHVSKIEAFMWCILIDDTIKREKIKAEYQKPI